MATSEREEPPQKSRKVEEGGGLKPAEGQEANRLDAFMRWARGLGGAVPCGMYFRRCDGFGIGAFAGRAMLPGEAVFHLPFSKCITAKSVAEEPWFAARMSTALKALERRQAQDMAQSDSIVGLVGPWILPNRVRLWLYLIHARLDIRSPHHDYVQLCPSEYDDPMWWSEEELAELGGSNLLAAVHREQQLVARRFDVHVKPLTTACPEMFPPDVFNMQGLLWARSLWASRAFPLFLAGEDRQRGMGFVGDSTLGALLPGVDFFNHKRGADMEWLIGSAGTGVSLRLPSDMPAGTAADEQFWINYGPKSDEEWLFNHGFLLEGNSEHNRVELVLLCQGPLTILRQAARLAKSLDSTAVVNREAGKLDATLQAGPFLLQDGGIVADVGVRSHLPEALVKLVSFLEPALHERRVSPGPRSWLIDSLEHRCAGLQTHANLDSAGADAGRRGRLTCARAYMANQRTILKNAVDHLRALSERDAEELFAPPSPLAAAQPEAGQSEEDRVLPSMRLLFAEDECADAGDGGDEDEQASEDGGSDSDAGDSSSESEVGSEGDAGGDPPLQDSGDDDDDDEAGGAGTGAALQQGGPPLAADDAGGLASGSRAEGKAAEKRFVLFGDGCAIRVTVSAD